MARGLGIAAAVLAGASLASGYTMASMAPGSLIFDNYNQAEISSEPLYRPSFTLTERTTIENILTYHFHNWVLSGPTGSIGLETDDGSAIGSWQASAFSLFEGAPVEWIVAPQNLVLDPGTYVVTDSNPEHWSHNLESGYTGFAKVYGTAVPEPTALVLLGGIAAGLMVRRRCA